VFVNKEADKSLLQSTQAMICSLTRRHPTKTHLSKVHTYLKCYHAKKLFGMMMKRRMDCSQFMRWHLYSIFNKTTSVTLQQDMVYLWGGLICLMN